jgi:tRNA(fMet)-specific endonuclease VapC
MMDAVLLDTDVFSFFHRGDTRAKPYEADVRERIRCLSFASVGELRFGAIVAGWQERRLRRLEDAIGRTVILPCDDEVTRNWARVRALRHRLGRPIASEDCWVAAVALRHQISLLTHNARDYADIPGLDLVCHSEP